MVAATLKESLMVSNKTLLLPFKQQLCSLVFTQKTRKPWQQQYLHTNVYSSFLPNCHNLETTWCPSGGKSMDKLWYIQTREYYSALKRNKLLRHQTTHRNLKCILLSGRSQSKKATHCMIPTTCFLKKTKLWTHPREKENFKEMNFNCFWPSHY